MKVYNIHDNKNFRLKRNRKSKKTSSTSQLPLFQTPVLRLSGRTFFEEALRLDELGDPSAREYYLKAIEEKENIADSYSNLGIIEAAHDRMKAFGYFLKSIQFNPSHCEAHFNIANLYFEEKDFHLAKLHYEIAKEIDPVFPNIYFNLALVNIELNEIGKAEQNLKLYIDLVGVEEGSDAEEILFHIKNMR